MRYKIVNIRYTLDLYIDGERYKIDAGYGLAADKDQIVPMIAADIKSRFDARYKPTFRKLEDVIVTKKTEDNE